MKISSSFFYTPLEQDGTYISTTVFAFLWEKAPNYAFDLFRSKPKLLRL